MQIIENWTCVTGIVLACSQPVPDKPASGTAERARIELQIEKTTAVEGVKSLLPEKRSEKIKVVMPEGFDTERQALLGKTLTLPVRMVRPGTYFADAAWSLENGSTKCGPNPHR